jgi:hypothetical protein
MARSEYRRWPWVELLRQCIGGAGSADSDGGSTGVMHQSPAADIEAALRLADELEPRMAFVGGAKA